MLSLYIQAEDIRGKHTDRVYEELTLMEGK